ncbi:unnamed protein product [Ectocarpus sp. CCAP 1310/34]|nr:unnamed protein product [Ectocarpus sp. CCAP 1310/34]
MEPLLSCHDTGTTAITGEEHNRQEIELGPLPFAPCITKPPVLACDHAEGVVDGHDRPLYAVDDVLNSSVLHHCASRFITKLADSVLSVSCALPNRDLLTADAKLTNCDAVRPLFSNYPGDNSNLLNSLVLQREGFKSTAPHRLRPKKTFFLGEFPAELKEATWVEVLAASPVRLSGTIIALEQLKVGRVPGSAKSMDNATERIRTDRVAVMSTAPMTTTAHCLLKWCLTFYDEGLFVAAFFDLFPHGIGGHLDERRRYMSFQEWAKILLRQRDPRFRKHKSFLFCVWALIFRREAIKNARWKLTGRMSRRTAETLATITPEDLAAAAKEMEQGSSVWSALANRNAVRTLLTTMESVHAGSSWTIYNKRSTRMIAISLIMQIGQPLWWMTIGPADTKSPIRLRLVASDPVASALLYHSVTDAVLTCLLRFDARDGDGGVLERVKGYLGMTKEQRRLMLHFHVLVWVYGFNDFSSFRDLMDKRPEKYNKLARFLERVIFNQVVSFANVNLAMHGHDHTPRASSEPEPENVSDPLHAFPVERCFVHDDSYPRFMYLDLAELVPGAQLHRCQPTCHKFNNRDKCRFGYGDKGKSFEQETTVVRGPCTFHTNGSMTINGVDAFNECVSASSEPESDRFTATLRLLSTHINPYNPIIHFLIRSNMDLNVMLRDSDARGLLYYVLHYSTKSEQTLDVLLPLLLPVVQRIRDHNEGEPAKETAVRLVRSCLCKQLTSLNIGGPAAASKVFGLPDAKISHTTVPCPMGPLLAWASSRDTPDEEPDDGDSTSGDDQEDSGDEASDDQHGVVVSVVGGRLTVNQWAHVLYLHRCSPEDTEHALHGMSYVSWTRLVRTERYTPFKKAYNCRQRVMRQGPVMVNIMRDIPRSDTKPEAHCRLLLCIFVALFELEDLKRVGDSWTTAMANVEQHDRWDKRTKPFRLNIAGMLRQRIAADEERAYREEEEAFVSGSSGQGMEMGSDGEDEIILNDLGGDDDDDQSVFLVTKQGILMQAFVHDAHDAFVSAGLRGNDSQAATRDVMCWFVPVECKSINARRDRNNQEVARTDIGAAAPSQHPVAFRIAQEFGLNREQRLAFYIFANGIFAKKRSPHSPIEEGGMLAVAFQGKQAASVGGTTIHSVCNVPGRKGSGGKDHDDQKGLTEDQALSWEGKSVLAVKEASMVGCEMELALDKAACKVFPMHKDKPFGNMVAVFCGDFNQLRFLHSRSTYSDVIKFNTRVLNGTPGLSAADCYDGKVITLRNKVTTALTMPTMRTWCQSRGTTLFISSATDEFVGDEGGGRPKETPQAGAAWPPCLRNEVNSLDDTKTKDLPRQLCLAVGVPIVVHKSPQHVLLGVCSNRDGIVRAIELDQREQIQNHDGGYRVVHLKHLPVRVFVHIESMDDSGLKLPGFPRGVVAFGPIERNVVLTGKNGRNFTIKRRQLPLTSGCLSSVRVILDLRKPPGPRVDPASLYVARSRAKSLNDTYLLFPVTLNDLSRPRDADVVALIDCLRRLAKDTLNAFTSDPSTFIPSATSLPTDSDYDSGENDGGRGSGWLGGASRRRQLQPAHLMPNSANNCFFNSAIALCLAVFDGHTPPNFSDCTPAATAFCPAIRLVKDNMLSGAPMPEHI